MESNKKSQDYLTKNLLFQLFLCAAIFLFMFALSKMNSDYFEKFKTEFSSAIEENISYERAKESFALIEKNVKAKIDKALNGNENNNTGKNAL